jgi:hypothetical protein
MAEWAIKTIETLTALQPFNDGISPFKNID